MASPLLQPQLLEGRSFPIEPDRHPFVVGDNGQAMFPAQTTQSFHLVGAAAQVDLPINNVSAVEVLTQCLAMGAAVSREDEDGVEPNHSTPRPVAFPCCSVRILPAVSAVVAQIGHPGVHREEDARIISPSCVDLDRQT